MYGTSSIRGSVRFEERSFTKLPIDFLCEHDEAYKTIENSGFVMHRNNDTMSDLSQEIQGLIVKKIGILVLGEHIMDFVGISCYHQVSYHLYKNRKMEWFRDPETGPKCLTRLMVQWRDKLKVDLYLINGPHIYVYKPKFTRGGPPILLFANDGHLSVALGNRFCSLFDSETNYVSNPDFPHIELRGRLISTKIGGLTVKSRPVQSRGGINNSIELRSNLNPEFKFTYKGLFAKLGLKFGLTTDLQNLAQSFLAPLCYEEMCYELCARGYMNVMPKYYRSGISYVEMLLFLKNHLNIAYTMLCSGEYFHENRSKKDIGEVMIVTENNNIFLLKGWHRVSSFHRTAGLLHGIHKWGLRELEYIKRMEILFSYFGHNGEMKTEFVPNKANLNRTQYEVLMIMLKRYSQDFLEKPLYWKVDMKRKNRALKIHNEFVVPRLSIGIKSEIPIPDELRQVYEVGKRRQLPPLDVDGLSHAFVRGEKKKTEGNLDYLIVPKTPFGPITELDHAKNELEKAQNHNSALYSPYTKMPPIDVFNREVMIRINNVSEKKKIYEKAEEKLLQTFPKPEPVPLKIIDESGRVVFPRDKRYWELEYAARCRVSAQERKIEADKRLKDEEDKLEAIRKEKMWLREEEIGRKRYAEMKAAEGGAKGEAAVSLTDSNWLSDSDESEDEMTMEELDLLNKPVGRLTRSELSKRRTLSVRARKNIKARERREKRKMLGLEQEKEKPKTLGLPPIPDQFGEKRVEHFHRLNFDSKEMEIKALRVPVVDLLKGVDGATSEKNPRFLKYYQHQKLYQATSKDRKFKKRYHRFRHNVYKQAEKSNVDKVKKYLSSPKKKLDEQTQIIENKYTLRSILYLSTLLGGTPKSFMLSWESFWKIWYSQITQKRLSHKHIKVRKFTTRDLKYFRTILPVIFENI